MAISSLTDTAIRKAKPSQHVIRLRDGNVKGLHLVISPNGIKTWALSYTSPETGQRRSLPPGIYKSADGSISGKPEMSLEDARDEARKLRSQITGGSDPALEKARHKATHREPHLVPLNDLAVRLLTQLRQITGENDYLFPNVTGKAPRTPMSLNQSITRFCVPRGTSKREPFEVFTARDLRRTAKTLMGKAGLSKEIRDRIQGHAFGDVASRHYDRHDYWRDKVEAMAKWCDWLDELVSGKRRGKVVSLRAGL